MPEEGEVESPADSQFEPTHQHLETVRIESREVVEEQLRLLRETDKKAIATTRIIALLIGIFLSAASLSDDPLAFTNAAVVLGGMFLFSAFVIGTFSFTADRPAQGIGPGYFDDELTRFETHQDVYVDLLVRYADWIDENITHIENNANYLLISQACLIAGLACLAVGMLFELGMQ